jgi:hypothetical protein
MWCTFSVLRNKFLYALYSIRILYEYRTSELIRVLN